MAEDTEPEQSDAFADKTLLIVDDDSGLRTVLRKWLRDEFSGLTIVEAETGEDAFELMCDCERSAAGEGKIDAVLMDVRLPGINGIEATRRIKCRLPNVPVIILSQHSASVYAEQSRQAGAMAYVVKRRSGVELLPALRKVLEEGGAG